MMQKIKNKDILRFKKACERLAKVIEDIQEYNPDAHLSKPSKKTPSIS